MQGWPASAAVPSASSRSKEDKEQWPLSDPKEAGRREGKEIVHVGVELEKWLLRYSCGSFWELGGGKEDKKAERVGIQGPLTASGAGLGSSVFHNGNSTCCVSGIPSKQQANEGLLYPSENWRKTEPLRHKVIYLNPPAKDLNQKMLTLMLIVSFPRSFHLKKGLPTGYLGS